MRRRILSQGVIASARRLLFARFPAEAFSLLENLFEAIVNRNLSKIALRGKRHVLDNTGDSKTAFVRRLFGFVGDVGFVGDDRLERNDRLGAKLLK
jgi:hypothetical protein